MKGEQKTGTGSIIIRRILLSGQFVISILLIIAIITNLKQLNYIRSLDLGFNKEHVIIKSTGESSETAKQTLKNRLLEIPGVINVSYSSNGIGGAPAVSPVFEVNGVKKALNFITVDADYIDVMDLEVIEGRGFEISREADKMTVGQVR